MHLVTYEQNGNWRAGIVINNNVVDAPAVAKVANIEFDGKEISNRVIVGLSPGQQSQLEKTARKLAESNDTAVHRMEDVRLGPPIPDPDKIISLGLNYKSRAEEAGFKAPEVPILFAKFRNALTGPTSPIILPSVSNEINYKGELAVVIGKQCKNVSAESALEYVAGYMALHDVSARFAIPLWSMAIRQGTRYFRSLRTCIGGQRNQ